MILDLLLPRRDGLDVCKRLRARSNVPIVVVTARVDEVDRLLGDPPLDRDVAHDREAGGDEPEAGEQ